MNLLVITQKVDRADHVLGFFHRWLELIAGRYGTVLVLCLKKGEYNLPDNVRVSSLGKEQKASRLRYLLLFYAYIVKNRRRYDAVFIHMNPIYAVLGCAFWLMFRKRFFLWYNHPQGGILARAAVFLAHGVFCTSSFAFANRYKKTKVMPAGIDTDFFKRNASVDRRPNALLYIGRVSPIKNIECMLDAAKLLDARGVDFLLSIVGGPMTAADEAFERMLHDRAGVLVNKGKVRFLPKVSHSETADYYKRAGVCLNATPTGSLDKTVLEAMACEVPVLLSNRSYCGSIPDLFIFEEENPAQLADKIESLFSLSDDDRLRCGARLRRYVIERHSLTALIKEIVHCVQ